MQEISLNYIELTPAQYGELMGTSKSAAIKRCEQGVVQAYRTPGGHWKIQIPKSDTVSRAEHEKALMRIADLESKINSMVKIATG